MCSPEPGHWPEGPRRTGHDIELEARDGTRLPVHICRPEGQGPWPVVLIIHDYYDPEHFYHELACRYAGLGYVGVVPDFFHRHGKLPEQTADAAGKRIGPVTDQEVFDDVNVVLEHLEEKQGPPPGLAVTGFCWGGRMSYLVAARHPEVKLLLPFYGHLAAWSGPDGPKPYNPLDEAAQIDARVLGFYGGQDQTIPLDDVREMEKRLREAGRSAELRVYPDSGHSFFRQDERQVDSDDAWQRIVKALQETF